MVVTPGGIQGGGVVISHHNITDRKWAELQLVRARDEWERTFDAVPDLIMLVDPDHRVRRANKAMAGRLGLAPQDMVGLNCYEAVHGLDQPPDFCPHVRLLTHGVEHEVEIREARLGGDFLVSVSPIRSPEGELMGSVHVARDITGQKKAEEALRKSHDHLERRVQERTAELRRLSSQLLKAQEEERRLIALELHDGIGQTLSAVKFRVESTVEYMNQEGLSKAVHALEPLGPMIHEAVEEVRRLQKNLRPSILDDLGILTTISWFCREFETIYPDIRIHQEVMIQEHDVPDPLKIVIFRVLQEALNNIAKHSKAHTVKLSLNRRNSRIHLIIKDSGMGFDVDHALSIGEHDRGLGLISMKERTELSGGSFSLESRIGAGTTVRASWPEHGESFGSI
jgi:PAS domain S-box-containing protein